MKRSTVVCLVLGVILMAGAAAADDYNPPTSWTRGDPGTTYQMWEFSTSLNPSGPETEPPFISPGSPSVEVMGDFFAGTEWFNTYNGRQGVWLFETEAIATIPNYDENPLKEVWVQITYFADNPPNVWVMPEGIIDDRVTLTMVHTESAGDAYTRSTFYGIVEPNPTWESFTIRPDDCTLYMDQLVIDTICLPEPTTLCLFGLGALALLRKRRS